MLKSPQNKFMSNQSVFRNFSKKRTIALCRSLLNFESIISSKLLRVIEAAAICSVMERERTKKQQNSSENTRACRHKTGLSSMKLISLIQIAGSSANQRSLNRVTSAFLSRKDRSDSARRVDQYTSEVTVKPIPLDQSLYRLILILH